MSEPVRSRLAAAAKLALLILAPAGCIASNVVAPEQRLVGTDAAQLQWTAADIEAIDGFYESIDIRGEAAVALRRIWYVFLGDGRYTGAALADVDGQLAFQTLSGTWSLTAEGLVFDGRAAVPCEMAPGHLRLSAPNGAVVLRKGTLQ